MKANRRQTLILTGLLLLAASAPVPRAAEGHSTAKSEPSPEVVAAWEKVVERLDYEGLPLSEVVQDLRHIFPKVNFIVPQSAMEAQVGHVTLRSVTLADILKAIELSSEGRIVASVAGSGAPGFPQGMPGIGAQIDPLTGQPLPPTRSNMVYFACQPNFGMPTMPNPVECRAFSLKAYLRDRTGAARDEAIKSLEEAISLALGMLQQADNQVEKPQFSIHAGGPRQGTRSGRADHS
jgi:hypothetical protein